MKSILSLATAASVLALAPAHAAPRLDPEARLAKQLEGRVAGEPVDCIDLHRVRSSHVIEDTAIVYDAGSTIYVNRPRSGREELDQWDVQVSKPFNNRLCSIDTVKLIDRNTQALTGLVFLGDFVPYRKPR